MQGRMQTSLDTIRSMTAMSKAKSLTVKYGQDFIYEIMESTFGGVSKILNGKKFPQNMRVLRLVVEELLRPLFNTEDLTSYHDLQRVLEDVAHDSRTAKVWVDCLIRAVFIMMVYVRAEREADWPLHIQAMKFIMPCLFARSY